MFKKLAALMLALSLWLPAAAWAQPAQELDEGVALPCVLQKALARFTCKQAKDFEFIGVREGVFVYNVHYGSYWAEFFVQISGDMAVFSSKAWKGRMTSARLVYDLNARCITAQTKDTRCSVQGEAKCCATLGQNSTGEVPAAVTPLFKPEKKKGQNAARKDYDMDVGDPTGLNNSQNMQITGQPNQQQQQMPQSGMPIVVSPQVYPPVPQTQNLPQENQPKPGSSGRLPQAPVYKAPKE